MPALNITNTILDEANQRTYVILAPRVLTDGEIYRAIRREILRRGGKPLAHGETLTMTVTSIGGAIASSAEPEPQQERPTLAMLNPNDPEPFSSPSDRLG